MPNASTETKPKAAHTPGPWSVDKDATDLISGGDGRRVAAVAVSYRDIDAIRANANLIAAAPDLLASLEWFVMLQPREGEGSIETFERVAEVFRDDTGFLRPGKDCMIHAPEVRRAAWDKWVADKVAEARAAISKARGQA